MIFFFSQYKCSLNTTWLPFHFIHLINSTLTGWCNRFNLNGNMLVLLMDLCVCNYVSSATSADAEHGQDGSRSCSLKIESIKWCKKMFCFIVYSGIPSPQKKKKKKKGGGLVEPEGLCTLCQRGTQKLVVVNCLLWFMFGTYPVIQKLIVVHSIVCSYLCHVKLCGFSETFCQRTWRNQLFPFYLSPASVQSKRRSLYAR